MNKPVIADNKPVTVDLSPGEEYHFCTCGRSARQPFCDGSHVGTGFTPRAFSVDEPGEKALCRCKHTANPPFCDGSHRRFDDDAVGREGDGVIASSGGMPKPGRTPEEPHVEFIHRLAEEGLAAFGHHGPMGAMGVPRAELPDWDDLQLMVAQMARKPLMEDAEVGTGLVIGPEARRPLELEIPLFVSDMSFGALSEEAKVAMARGAEMAGTGICSGEGGMLPEEQAENGRYF
jgi:CDGSH-type Zn-finger protein